MRWCRYGGSVKICRESEEAHVNGWCGKKRTPWWLPVVMRTRSFYVIQCRRWSSSAWTCRYCWRGTSSGPSFLASIYKFRYQKENENQEWTEPVCEVGRHKNQKQKGSAVFSAAEPFLLEVLTLCPGLLQYRQILSWKRCCHCSGESQVLPNCMGSDGSGEQKCRDLWVSDWGQTRAGDMKWELPKKGQPGLPHYRFLHVHHSVLLLHDYKLA